MMINNTYAAKPVSQLTLFNRIKGAVLVLIGKAIAVKYTEEHK